MKKKSYEIWPGTSAASLETAIQKYGLPSPSEGTLGGYVGIPIANFGNPSGRMGSHQQHPMSGGVPTHRYGKQPKSYEIMPPSGLATRGTKGCGCEGKCSGGSDIQLPWMLPKKATRSFGGAGLGGRFGGLVEPSIQASDVNPILRDWKPLGLTCNQAWARYRTLAHEYVQWQWARSLILDAQRYYLYLRDNPIISMGDPFVYCNAFNDAAGILLREANLFASGRSNQENEINLGLNLLARSLMDLSTFCAQEVHSGGDRGDLDERADGDIIEALNTLDVHNAGIVPEICATLQQMMSMGCELPARFFWGRPTAPCVTLR